MVAQIKIRCYEELNSYLSPERRKKTFSLEFPRSLEIRDVLNTLGIPEERIDLILVNGIAATAEKRLEPDDRLALYPVFETFDISEVSTIHQLPLRTTRFVLDSHLGKLARLLRLLGFDSLYIQQADRKQLIALSLAEERVLLTRNEILAKSRVLQRAYRLRSELPREQIAEVIKRFELTNCLRPFTRCLVCNGILSPVTKEEVWPYLEDKTKAYYHEFFRCSFCNRIFWPGSHYVKMQTTVAEIMEVCESQT